MKKFNETDGIYDHCIKGITAFSTFLIMIFAVFGYFYTIKPIFDRDKAKKEIEQVVAEKNSVLIEIKNISIERDLMSKELVEIKGNIDTLAQTKSKLESEISALHQEVAKYEDRIRDLLKDKDEAGFFAIQAKLNLLIQEVFNKYLLKAGSIEKKPLNLKQVAMEIAKNHSKNVKMHLILRHYLSLNNLLIGKYLMMFIHLNQFSMSR